MNNTSIRARFGIAQANEATALRIIREALDAGVIRLVSKPPDKPRAYEPFSASAVDSG